MTVQAELPADTVCQTIPPPCFRFLNKKGDRSSAVRNLSRKVQGHGRLPKSLIYLDSGLLYMILSEMKNRKDSKMTEKTINKIEEVLRKEVQKIDQSVQVVAVEQGKKKNSYRVTLLKEGKSASADLQKDLIEQHLAQKGQGRQLRKALAKAVSHLSIRYGR